LQAVEQIKYKLVDVQPAKAVNRENARGNARIDIGFVPPWKDHL
jgi:hypothetical protein